MSSCVTGSLVQPDRLVFESDLQATELRIQNMAFCKVHLKKSVRFTATMNTGLSQLIAPPSRTSYLMTKPPTIGKCVHCLREGVVRNWDHVFPVGWY